MIRYLIWPVQDDAATRIKISFALVRVQIACLSLKREYSPCTRDPVVNTERRVSNGADEMRYTNTAQNSRGRRAYTRERTAIS